ncbi:MAG: oligopeptide/dipeptide ABC transporter ATP-binding protein [Planctomycetota bacterium]
MLDIKDLKVRYGEKTILRGIDLELTPGETLGIVGESGTGKTTLGLSLMGLLQKRSTDAIVEGDILFDENNISELDPDEQRALRGNRLSMVFQNTDDALNPAHRVFQQVREPLIVHELCTGAAADERAHGMLGTCGLPESRFMAYPHELSIGEKQRVIIAMALVSDPDVLILDEPTSSLDAVSTTAINDMLKNMARRRMCLVITHDLGSAASLSDRVAVLCGGRIVEIAATDALFNDPRHPYSRGLIRCYPDMSRSKDLQGIRGRAAFAESGCPFYGRCTQAVDICPHQTPPLRRVNGRHIACHRGGVVPLLNVEGLAKKFDGKTVLNEVDLTIYEGETLALVGESGAGKTTLARCLVGLNSWETGTVCLEGQTIDFHTSRWCRKVQMIFQNPREAISHRMTVLDAVREPLDVHNIGTRDQRMKRVQGALRDAELPHDTNFLQRYPHHLSGGEIQRIVIARALVLEPEILIADEPTSSLDVSIQAKILQLLNEIQQQRGLSILLITHDIALARKVSDRMAVLNAGCIMERGSTDRVLSAPSHDYTKQLIRAAHDLHAGTNEMMPKQ